MKKMSKVLFLVLALCCFMDVNAREGASLEVISPEQMAEQTDPTIFRDCVGGWCFEVVIIPKENGCTLVTVTIEAPGADPMTTSGENCPDAGLDISFPPDVPAEVIRAIRQGLDS